MAPKPQANTWPAPLQPEEPRGINGLFSCGLPTLAAKMWRLNMLKNSARKSIVAFSPKILVFLPRVKSSSRPPKVRAAERDRGSLPNVNGSASENAAGFQNGVVKGFRLELLLVSLTPGTTFTRAAPVNSHPPNKTAPAVFPHGPYTSVGVPDL